MAGSDWRVTLSSAAELDFANILHWTASTFGRRRARVYRDILLQAIGTLTEGPDLAGSRLRREIRPGIRTLHVARGRRRGHHFLLYRCIDDETIEILRLLHDSMDLPRHLPPSTDT